MRTLRHSKIVLLLFLCLPACAQDQDIKIGVSAAFKGPSRFLGIELYRGSMAYIDYINANGGLNGRKITVLAMDDGYNPRPAINNTVQFVEGNKVFALFDYVGTPTVTRVLPLLKIYNDRDIFLLFPFTGAQPQREKPYSDYVFNLRASYRQETAALVENLVSIGRKRIAVFYQADAYGRSGWEGVRMELAKSDLKIVGEATYRRGASFLDSFRQQINILKASNPDAVIMVGTYGPCAGFVRDARDEGWEVPVGTLSFVGVSFMLKLLNNLGGQRHKDYTGHLICSTVVPPYDDNSYPAAREFRELMDRFKPPPPEGIQENEESGFKDNNLSFEGFLNAKLLVEILKRCGDPPDRKQIRHAVESLKSFDVGIKTPISFGPDKNQGLDIVYFTTVQNGRLVPIIDWRRWQP